jgi:hypothetical protein
MVRPALSHYPNGVTFYLLSAFKTIKLMGFFQIQVEKRGKNCLKDIKKDCAANIILKRSEESRIFKEVRSFPAFRMTEKTGVEQVADFGCSKSG